MNAALVSIPVQKPTLAQVITDKIRESLSLEETKEYYRFMREIQADEAKAAFHEDFVQLKFPEIPKLGRIEIGRGKAQQYARWEDINDKIEPVLLAHGFRLTFDLVEESDTSVTLEAILVHRRGHSISTRKKLPLDKSGSKNIVQAYGSTQSYAQRYAAIALLNLTSRGEDDDAASINGAGLQSASDKFFITPEQSGKLTEMIDQTGRTVERFCMKYRIDHISELPASKYKEAVAFLDTHIPKAQP